MMEGAREVLRIAQAHGVALAVLMDVSAACGSTVIYDGHRAERRYQRGYGVAAALLVEHGITVISQRDHRALERVMAHCDPAHVIDEDAVDHCEGAWYRDYFREG